jgi:2-keto-4-pentenoate hydratase
VSNGRLLLADHLVEAHRTGGVVSGIQIPATLQDAMQIQRSVADGLGESLAGWKVAIHPEHGAVAAPLFKGLTRHAPAEWPWSEGLSLEVEIAVRLKHDLPRKACARADIIDAFESMVLGVELVKPRLAAGAATPFLAFLADNLGNAGYIVGTDARPWSAPDLKSVTCAVSLNGEVLHHAPARHQQGDPLLPLLAYATVQNDRFGGLRAGQLITTGSLCGLIPIPQAGVISVELGIFGAIRLGMSAPQAA